MKGENKKFLELFQQEKEKTNSILVEFEESEKNRKAMVNHLEEADFTIAKLKQLYEDLLKKEKKSDYESLETNKRADESNKKINQLIDSLSQLRNENTKLSLEYAELEEKNDELTRQLKIFQSEQDRLKGIVEASKVDKFELENQMKQLNDMLTKESQNYLDIIANIKKEESNKIEKEINEQVKLRTKLNQLESKLKNVTIENNESEKRMNEYKNQSNNAENSFSELQNQVYDLESKLNLSDINNKDLQRKIEKTNLKSFEYKQRIFRLFSNKINMIKSEALSLKNSCLLEMQMNKKKIEELSHELADHLLRKITVLRSEMNDRTEKIAIKLTNEYELKLKDTEVIKLEEKLRQENHYEKLIQNLTLTKDKLQIENDELKQEQIKNKEMLEDFRNAVSRFKSKLEKVESEKQQLHDLLNQRINEFETLKTNVNHEVTRLKEESQALLSEKCFRIEEKHKKDLISMHSIMDELKYSNIARLQKLESEITKLHSAFNMEQAQLRTYYDFKIDNYEKELSLLENEWNISKREKKILKLELEKVNENFKRLENENQNTLTLFEEKMTQYKDVIQQDNEKYVTLKNQYALESERIKHEVKDLNKELMMKNHRIEELNKIKDEYKIEINKLKALVDQKDKVVDNQQKEVQRISKYRDKEIEELQTLLTKSLKSINSSVDHNMKIASKLDQETEEIAKSIKSGRPLRESNSLRPLINVVGDSNKQNNPNSKFKSDYY